MHEVVLCADDETMRDPSLIGLEGELLDSQGWLRTVSGAQEARMLVASDDAPDEVWVASSNEVDPINLAATLKRDRADKTVCLVAWRGSGSLMSRAAAAGIDEVMSYSQLSQRYAELKRAHRAPSARRRTPERAIAQQLARAHSGVGTHDPAMVRDTVSSREPEVRRVPETMQVPGVPGEPELTPEPHPGGGGGGEGQAAPVAQVAQAMPAEADGQPGQDPVQAGGAWERPAFSSGPEERRGYALSVVSASGGTGKSTVAVLSALIAASHGYRTLLIDGDLQFGDAAILLGEEEGLALEKAMADPSCLDAAQPAPGKPVLVRAPAHLEHCELYLAQMPGLIDRARDSFEVVVVNTGSFWTEAHIQFMEASTNTLFLVDQRPTSLKAARRALDLCARCGVASTPFLFAVNRCARNSLLSSIDVSCALNGVPVAELREGGNEVAELAGAGLASQLVESRNELCVSLNDFLGSVIPAALGEKIPDEAPAKTRNRRRPQRKRRKIACL